MGDNLQEELPAGEKLKGRLVNMCTINGGASTVGWVEVLDTTEEVEIICNIIPWTAPGRLAYSPPYLTCDQRDVDELLLQRGKEK